MVKNLLYFNLCFVSGAGFQLGHVKNFVSCNHCLWFSPFCPYKLNWRNFDLATNKIVKLAVVF